MERQLLEAQSRVAEARSQKGIRADLYAQFGLSQTSEEISNVYQDPNNNQRVEVGVQVPILDWGLGRGQYRMAQSAEEVVKTDVRQSQIDFDENIFLQVMQFNLQGHIQIKYINLSNQEPLLGDFIAKVGNGIGFCGNGHLVILEEKDVARRGYVQALRNFWDYYYDLRGLTLYDWQKDIKLTDAFDEEDLLDQ